MSNFIIIHRYPAIDDISLLIDQSKTIYSQTSVQGASSKTKISIEKSKAQFINSISTIYSKIDKGIKDIVDTSETSRRNSEKINIKKFKK